METKIDMERILAMIDPAGFNKKFEEEIMNCDTYEDAFNALNDEYREATGNPRYSSYDSFRLCRSRRIKL